MTRDELNERNTGGVSYGAPRDAFDAWAGEHGLPATRQIDGDEVVLATSPDLAQDHDRLAELIRDAARVIENGPRSALRAILEAIAGYGMMDSTDALRSIRAAVDAANSARYEAAMGNDLAAQEHESRVAVYLEALEDQALELESEVER
jgi:hypothetical protein